VKGTVINYVEEAKKFIKRLDENLFTTTSAMREAKYVFDPKTSDYRMDTIRKTMALGDCLRNAITFFENARTNAERLHYATLVHDYKRKAMLMGALQESSGNIKKLEAANDTIAVLQKKLEALSDKYLEAANKIEKYERDYPFLKKKPDGNIGT